MKPGYDEALLRLHQINEQISSLIKEREKIQSFLEMYNEFAGTTKAGSQAPLKKVSAENAIKAVMEILADGRSYSTRTLLDRLKEFYRIEITGKDDQVKIINLSSILVRERNKNGTLKVNRATGWSLERIPSVSAQKGGT